MRILFHWLLQDKNYSSFLESVLDGDFAVGEYYSREGQFSGPPTSQAQASAELW